VIGPNGVGKTTLFKTIVGLEQPDSGIVRSARRCNCPTSTRTGLGRPKKTVWEVVSDGLDYIRVGHVEMPSRAYVAAFGFKGRSSRSRRGAVRR